MYTTSTETRERFLMSFIFAIQSSRGKSKICAFSWNQYLANKTVSLSILSLLFTGLYLFNKDTRNRSKKWMTKAEERETGLCWRMSGISGLGWDFLQIRGALHEFLMKDTPIKEILNNRVRRFPQEVEIIYLDKLESSLPAKKRAET